MTPQKETAREPRKCGARKKTKGWFSGHWHVCSRKKGHKGNHKCTRPIDSAHRRYCEREWPQRARKAVTHD